jgi:hypothetical protein
MLAVFVLPIQIYSQFKIDFLEPSFGDQNGQIIVSISGTASPFTLTLSSEVIDHIILEDAESGTFPFTNLGEGTYVVSLVDKLGCMAGEEVIELVGDCPSVGIGVVDIMHVTDDFTPNGQISLNIDSDLSPSDYTLRWYFENQQLNRFENELELTFLDPGVYRIEAELHDFEDCLISEDVIILDCFFSVLVEGQDGDDFDIEPLTLLPPLELDIVDIVGATNGLNNGSIISDMIIRNQCPNFDYPGYECTENGTASWLSLLALSNEGDICQIRTPLGERIAVWKCGLFDPNARYATFEDEVLYFNHIISIM